MTPTIIVDTMELLAADFRRAGYPVAEITVEQGWITGGEPDAVERENGRERTFYAPHFHWTLEDGRRFHGKPNMHLKRKRVRLYFGLINHERVDEDKQKMRADLRTMIVESCSA